MCNKIISTLCITLSLLSQLYAANAPTQRIEVVNMLGSVGGATESSIVVSFASANTPCLTTTIPFQGVVTVLVGVGQVCTNPITSVTVTPAASKSNIIYYDAPMYPITIDKGFYLYQLTISQGISPVFEPTNGSLIGLGTIQTTLLNY